MQHAGAATHIHTERLPREWQLKDALAQIAGKEQPVGLISAKSSQKVQLGCTDVLRFIHEDMVERRVFASRDVFSDLAEHLCHR